MNFNDFGASLVTLFAQMVVNNWYITCDMMMFVTQSRWPALFFVAFWIVQVNMMLNVVIAFVMEIYNSVSEDLSIEYARREYVLHLQSEFQNSNIAQPRNSVDEIKVEDVRDDFDQPFRPQDLDASSDSKLFLVKFETRQADL